MSDNPSFSVTPINPNIEMSDDEVLSRVRGVRLSILDRQIAEGVPVDNDSWSRLHQNLQELDKGAVTNKRLAQEDKSADTAIAMANAIAESMIRAMGNGGRDVYAVAPDKQVGTMPDPLKEIQGTSTVVPGELMIGDDTGNYDEFQSTVGRKLEEERRKTPVE